jgi:hypothetical protein
MPCQKCNSTRIANVDAKCDDRFSLSIEGDAYSLVEVEYVPEGLNIGGGDYIDFDYCLDCGQIQGSFPITEETIEEIRNGEG